MELKGTKTEKNLWEAFAGESQARNKYTFFASVAKKEGYEQLAAIFEETAANEKEHAKMWFKALNGGEMPDVMTCLEQQVWQCRNCGYTYIGKSAPLKCPVCAHPQSYFELKKHNY